MLTNSVPVAMELSGNQAIELLSGGQVRNGDAACFGRRADDFFEDFYAGKAFLGSGGVHPDAGLTDFYPHEAATRRVIIAHAGASYAPADSSKLGTVAVGRLPLAALDGLRRRTRAMNGRCQGFYCAARVGRLFSTGARAS